MYHLAYAIAAYHLLVLHGPGGQVIQVSPEEVVSLRTPRGETEHLQKGIRCIVNTTDGKFSALVEDCDTIRLMIEDERNK